MADFSALKQTIQVYIKQNGNEEITGNILQDVLLAMVTTMGDGAINTLTQSLQNEITARGNADTALGNRLTAVDGSITTINTMLGAGYLYAGLATTSTDPGTPTGKVFYIATAAGTYTNFLDSGSTALVVTQGINILKFNGTAWSQEQVWAVDDVPTAGSDNLIKSGGVFDNIGALDVSELNATENPHTLAKYADLSAALAAVPSDYQKGGMSIKFVQSSDNKYVQYRLINQSFTTNIEYWRGETYIENRQNVVVEGAALLIEDGYLSIYNGSVQSGGGYKTSDYIPINTEQDIYIRTSCESQYVAAVCFYNESKTYISNSRIVGPVSELTILKSNLPINAKYIRFCSNNFTNVKFANESIGIMQKALREVSVQIDKNTDDIDNIQTHLTVLDGLEGQFTISGYLSIYNGSLIESDNYRVTDFLIFDKNVTLKIKTSTPSGSLAYGFYNVLGGFISGQAGNGSLTEYTINASDIPTNAYYIRIGAYAYESNVCSIDFGSVQDVRVQNITNPFHYPKVNVLILGDSYSQKEYYAKWMDFMLKSLPQGSSYISLAVGSAKIKDNSNDRTTYPYTSRPVSTDNTTNHNTLACQIEKLKRLMAGTDLDEGETQIYTTPSEYPNVIIIEGGMNDWADSEATVETYYDQLDTLVENVYKKSTPTSEISLGSVGIKTPIENVNRTCFAGAYRYIMEELLNLFPNAQIFFTTVSPISYRNNRVSQGRCSVANQQRLCADIFGATLIDWHRDGQINSIVNYAHGSGTQEDPYLVAYQTGDYVDTNDQLHPNNRGYAKYGRIAALKIIESLMIGYF